MSVVSSVVSVDGCVRVYLSTCAACPYCIQTMLSPKLLIEPPSRKEMSIIGAPTYNYRLLIKADTHDKLQGSVQLGIGRVSHAIIPRVQLIPRLLIAAGCCLVLSDRRAAVATRPTHVGIAIRYREIIITRSLQILLCLLYLGRRLTQSWNFLLKLFRWVVVAIRKIKLCTKQI